MVVEEILGELQAVRGSVLDNSSGTLESRRVLAALPVGGVALHAVLPEEKAVDDQHQAPLLTHGELR